MGKPLTRQQLEEKLEDEIEQQTEIYKAREPSRKEYRILTQEYEKVGKRITYYKKLLKKLKEAQK